jgi:hypothetical protein
LTAVLKSDTSLLSAKWEGSSRKASVRDLHCFRLTWGTGADAGNAQSSHVSHADAKVLTPKEEMKAIIEQVNAEGVEEGRFAESML